MKPLALFIALILVTLSHAQPLAAQPTDTVNFHTQLGSFKLINGSGQVEFTFTGTVLLSNVSGTSSVTGDVRKEFDRNGKQVWFGTGKVTVDGKFRAIQWFGRNLKGKWTGHGLCRFVGEFDRDLNTGEYWYASNPSKVENWGTFREAVLPPQTFEKPKPIDRDTLKKKSGGG